MVTLFPDWFQTPKRMQCALAIPMPYSKVVPTIARPFNSVLLYGIIIYIYICIYIYIYTICVQRWTQKCEPWTGYSSHFRLLKSYSWNDGSFLSIEKSSLLVGLEPTTSIFHAGFHRSLSIQIVQRTTSLWHILYIDYIYKSVSKGLKNRELCIIFRMFISCSKLPN